MKFPRRRVLAFLLLVVAAGPVPAKAGAEPGVADLLIEADRLHARGNYAAELETLLKARALASREAPNAPASAARILGKTARAHWRAGNLAASREATLALRRAAARDGEFLRELGWTLAEQGERDEALRLLKKRFAADPKDEQAGFVLGRLYRDKGEHPRALKTFERVLASHPESFQTYMALAETYRLQKKFHESKEVYALGRGICTDCADLLTSLGYSQLKEGDYDGALSTFESLRPLTPSGYEAYQHIGVFFFMHGKYLQAEAAFQHKLALLDALPGVDLQARLHALNTLGMLYGQMGRYEESEQAYGRVLTLTQDAPLSPWRLTSFAGLGIIHDNRGRFDAAAQAWGRLLEPLEKAPDAPWECLTLLQAAYVSALQGKTAQAEKFYKHGLALAEESPAMAPILTLWLGHLGDLYARQGRREEAGEAYARALKLSPADQNPIWTTYLRLRNAQHHAARGEDALARPLYQEVFAALRDADGGDRLFGANYCVDAGERALESGDWSQARRYFDQALEQTRESILPLQPRILAGRALAEAGAGDLRASDASSARAVALLARQPKYPRTARPLLSLAGLYVQRAKTAQARALYLRAQRVLAGSPDGPGRAAAEAGLAALPASGR